MRMYTGIIESVSVIFVTSAKAVLTASSIDGSRRLSWKINFNLILIMMMDSSKAETRLAGTVAGKNEARFIFVVLGYFMAFPGFVWQLELYLR